MEKFLLKVDQWRRVSSEVSSSDGVQLGGEVLIIKYH